METAIKPNVIVAYHGGGYDGCFWEWNYAFIDESGEFHNIYSRGIRGCDTLEKLQNVLGDKNTQLTDVADPVQLQKFCDTESLTGLARCAEWFAKHKPDIKITVGCDECGKRIDICGGKAGDVECTGGVHLEVTKVICEECYEKRDID